MIRCVVCERAIEKEDLVEEPDPADPLEILHYHFWCFEGKTEEDNYLPARATQ